MQTQQHGQSQSQVLQSYTSQQLQPTIRNDTRPGFANRTITGLSLCQLLLGGIAVALGIVAIVIKCVSSELGCGIWCGVFFMVSGLIGLISASKKTNGLIITFMVLSVVSASLFAPVLLSASVAMISQEEYGNDDYLYYDACLAVESLLGLTAVAEAVIAIIASAFCCRAVCCDQPLMMMHGVPTEGRSIRQEDLHENTGLLSNQCAISSDLQCEHHRTSHYGSTHQTACTNTSGATPHDMKVPGYQQTTDFTPLQQPQLVNHQQQQPLQCLLFVQPQQKPLPPSQLMHVQQGETSRPLLLPQSREGLEAPQQLSQQMQQTRPLQQSQPLLQTQPLQQQPLQQPRPSVQTRPLQQPRPQQQTRPQMLHQTVNQQSQHTEQQHIEPDQLQKSMPLQQQPQLQLAQDCQATEHQQYQQHDLTNVEGATANADGDEASTTPPPEYYVDDDKTSPLVENEVHA
ncbi:uncharacterized protein [Ptychodera flava]|uniref:uncharacterized protein n=1 Tax=Ptychodera flava TaxID=63121 RepID=UPI00396A7B08